MGDCDRLPAAPNQGRLLGETASSPMRAAPSPTHLKNVVLHVADLDGLAAVTVLFRFIGHQRLEPGVGGRNPAGREHNFARHRHAAAPPATRPAPGNGVPEMTAVLPHDAQGGTVTLPWADRGPSPALSPPPPPGDRDTVAGQLTAFQNISFSRNQRQ